MKIFIVTEKGSNKVKNIFTWHNENDLPEDYPIADDEQINTTENEAIYDQFLQRQGQNKIFRLVDINKNTFEEMFQEEEDPEANAQNNAPAEFDLPEEIRIIREAVYQIIKEQNISNEEFENYYSKVNKI